MNTIEISEKWNELFRYSQYPEIIQSLLVSTSPNLKETLVPGYLSGDTGLMVDFITSAGILVAVFPSQDIFTYIRENDIRDHLLFVKHPMDWEECGVGFRSYTPQEIDTILSRHISMYSAHSPMDNSRLFSPSYHLAKSLDGNICEEIIIGGRNYGYVVELDSETDFAAFKRKIQDMTGLERLQEQHKSDNISRVAAVAGGGDSIGVLESCLSLGCDTILTGILKFEGSEYARQHNPPFIERLKASPLNAFGAGHYPTEKYGLIAFSSYCSSMLSVPCRFIEENSKIDQLKQEWGLEI